MIFTIEQTTPPVLTLIPDHPLADLLADLLGLAATLDGLELPEPDADGIITLPPHAQPLEVTLAGLTLTLGTVRVGTQAPHVLALAATARLPAPLAAVELSGAMLVRQDGMRLDLSPAQDLALTVGPAVEFFLPAGTDLSAEIGSAAPRLVLDLPAGSPARVDTPAGTLFLTSLECTDEMAEIGGQARLTLSDAFEADCPDLLLRFGDGQVDLLGRAASVARFASGDIAANLGAQGFALLLDAEGVREASLSNATVAAQIPLLGATAAGGSLSYVRLADVPEGGGVQGPRWILTVDEVSLPGGLDGLVPQGQATARIWPDHGVLEVQTSLVADLPFLGAVEAGARFRRLGSLLTVNLTGALAQELTLGPDLPAIGLGPTQLELVFDRLLEGMVADEFGQPLPGASVSLYDGTGALLATIDSDDEGHFEVLGPAEDVARIEVPGRRVTQVTGAGDAGRSRGTYALIAMSGLGTMPITVPPGFPIFSDHSLTASFHWTRGAGAGIAFPNGLPPVTLGPLELTVDSLTAGRRADGESTLTTLELTATGGFRLPVWAEPFQLTLSGTTVDWRDMGERRIDIDSAVLHLPDDLPVLAGATFSGSLSLSSVPAGSGMVGDGFEAEFRLGTAGTTLSAAGLTLRFTGSPRLHVVQAPEDDFPAASLTSGTVALGFAFGSVALDTLSFGPDQLSVAGSVALQIDPAPVSFDTATGALMLGPDGWSGSLEIAALAIDLGPLQITTASVAGSIAHDDDRDELRISLKDVDFGPLGVQADATLVIRETRTGAATRNVFIEAETRWEDLPQLPAPHPDFPDLPSSGAVTARLEWEDSPAGLDLSVSLAGEVEDADILFAAIPTDFRPAVERFAFVLRAAFEASDLSNASVEAELDLRLPQIGALPGAEAVTISTGDAEGVIRARLKAGFEAQDDGTDAAYLRLSLQDALHLGLSLPGMPQDDPTMEIDVDRVSFDLGVAGDPSDLTAAFRAKGGFVFRPPDPPSYVPLGHHIRQLIDSTGLDTIEGDVALQLAFTPDAAALELTGTFEDAEIDIDLFAMLSDLTRGLGAPAETGGESTLSVEAGFRLEELGFRFGPPIDELAGQAPAADSAQFEFGLGFAFHLGEFGARARLKLSDKEMSLLLDDVVVPLSFPVFPLMPEDLDDLESDMDWANRRASLPDDRVGAFDVVRTYWNAVRPQRRAAFLGNARFFVAKLRETTEAIHVDTPLALRLSDIGVIFPFADPAALRVQGDAGLVNFPEDDPLRVLESLEFGLGLSADRIFFQLKTTTQIDLPDLGRYPGGSVDLSQFSIGYGYTRNSLAVNIAGNVILPPKLVEDADTSQRWGAGIRLPTHNRLGFRLDLIPVSLGPVEFILPLVEFEADLRAPNSPPYADLARCLPYWDGLQVIVPGALQADLKHLAFAPFFTFLPAPNLRLDWDLAIGDDENGLRIIANDFLYFSGVILSSGGPTPVPMLAAPTDPYFENLCVRMRLAGFGIQFDLERPFPSVNPLAIFEVLGLLSDPQMEIDPNGHLANSVRVSLKHGRITLPEHLSALFPGVPGVDKDLEITLNLGTLITGVQTVSAALEPAFDTLLLGGADTRARLEALQSNPPEFDMGALVGLLPAELRKHRLACSFAGFEAGAVLLLLSPKDAMAEMARRGTTATPHADLAYTPEGGADTDALRHLEPRVPGHPLARRHADAAANLFDGLEFDGFDTTDLASLPAPPGPGVAGVMLGAHVTLLPGQRARFAGALYEDGRFALVSTLGQPPLSLPVAGISAPCPLAFSGRLTLEGRSRRYRSQARVTAEASLNWNILPIPGLAVAQVESARLSLDSSGRFRVSGDGSLSLFSGAASVTGRFDITDTHCLVEGGATLAFGDWGGEPVLALELGDTVPGTGPVRCRVGPGHRFELGGSGRAKILGQEVSDVTASLTERGAEIEAELTALQIGNFQMPDISLGLAGAVRFDGPNAPRYRLEGRADLGLGPLALRGRGGIDGDAKGARVFAEGAALWQGCRWAEARVEFGTAAMRFSGRTSFVLPLTPDKGGLGLDLANLVLKVTLAGQFDLGEPKQPDRRERGDKRRTEFTPAKCRIEGDCVLAVRLPSGGSDPKDDQVSEQDKVPHDDQVLPLARRAFAGEFTPGSPVQLLNLKNVDLLPFQPENLSITLPNLSVDPDDPVTFSVRAMRTDDASPWPTAGHYLEASAGTAKLLFPLPPTETSRKTVLQSVAISVPKVSQDGTRSLSLLPELEIGFSVELVWIDNALGIRIVRDGDAVLLSTLRDLLGDVGHIDDLLES